MQLTFCIIDGSVIDSHDEPAFSERQIPPFAAAASRILELVISSITSFVLPP